MALRVGSFGLDIVMATIKTEKLAAPHLQRHLFLSPLLVAAALAVTFILLSTVPGLTQQAADPAQESVQVNWAALDQLRGGSGRSASANAAAPAPYSDSNSSEGASAGTVFDTVPTARPLPMPAPVATTSLQPERQAPISLIETTEVAADPEPVETANAAPVPAAAITPVPEVAVTPDVPGDNDLLMQLAFRGQSDTLTSTAMQQLTQLAVRMDTLAGRLQVRSYAAPTDSSSSSARKLSFKRALAVRSFLIEQGIRSTRVDLRALGPAEDGGLPDRVDIILTTG